MKNCLTIGSLAGAAVARRSGVKAPVYARGFTLLELMIVLVLVAILLGVGGPSFQSSLQRNRLQSAYSNLAGALAFSRAEAVIRSDTVSMCPTVDTSGCSGTSWETGWLIFLDNGVGTGGVASDGLLNGSELLMRIGEPAPAGVTIRTVNFPSTANLVFTDSGRVQQDINGTFTVCDARGATDALGLIVEVSGQARRAVDVDANGTSENDDGNALVCP